MTLCIKIDSKLYTYIYTYVYILYVHKCIYIHIHTHITDICVYAYIKSLRAQKAVIP